MRRAIKRAFYNFAEKTTLHGFKYLSSPHYSDRFIWIAGCCVSATCAGVLCSVLWARFAVVPAVLILQEPRTGSFQPLPKISICPTPEFHARLFLEKLSLDPSVMVWLPNLLKLIFRRKKSPNYKLLMLENVLHERNMTFLQAVYGSMPPCEEMVTRCRWGDISRPCKDFFNIEMVPWGLCCSMRVELAKPEDLSRLIYNKLIINQKVELILVWDNLKDFTQSRYQFPDEKMRAPLSPSFLSTMHTLETPVCLLIFLANIFEPPSQDLSSLVSKFSGAEYDLPTPMRTGTKFTLNLIFNKLSDDYSEKLVDASCRSKAQSSKTRCLLLCKEHRCGCADPLRSPEHAEREKRKQLDTCTLPKFNCIVDKTRDDECKCIPLCKKVTSKSSNNVAELAPVYTYDSLYRNLSIGSTVAVTVVVWKEQSKILSVVPTETWLTLMSSLGGVFNMFLGVGLFSALEIIYLFVIKLPITALNASLRKYRKIKKAPLAHPIRNNRQ